MMDDAETNTDLGGRSAPRQGLEGKVTVRFDAGAIVGSGENIADQGVFFTAEGRPARSPVEIEGQDGRRVGELVRVNSMGNGRLGIAIKFVDSNDISQPPQ